MEIIEIGAVVVDSTTGSIESEFQSFVRPSRHPILTEFCKKLTSITQEQVGGAPDFPQTMTPFSRWLSEVGDYDFCSWGFYDKGQFERDCEFHSVPYPFADPHRNLKEEVSRLLGSKKKLGLGNALRKLGIAFDGTPHRGIDDARNIARIYAEMIAPMQG